MSNNYEQKINKNKTFKIFFCDFLIIQFFPIILLVKYCGNAFDFPFPPQKISSL